MSKHVTTIIYIIMNISCVWQYLNPVLLSRLGCGTDNLRNRGSIPGRIKTFFFSKASIAALGLTQPLSN